MNFRKIVLTLSFCALCTAPQKSFAGWDAPILLKILAENIKQLIELQKIFENGKRSLELMREINRGINDSLNMVRTVNPNIEPGLYSELQKTGDVLRRLKEIYGISVSSPDSHSQESVDQSIAEAITMNNNLYDYTKNIDRIGEDIKTYSHSVSPGGAQKLTAQSLGVLLHVLNQSLRAQGTLLKLQAQALAQNNKHEKDYTAQYLKSSEVLSNAMKSSHPKFERPRF